MRRSFRESVRRRHSAWGDGRREGEGRKADVREWYVYVCMRACGKEGDFVCPAGAGAAAAAAQYRTRGGTRREDGSNTEDTTGWLTHVHIDTCA